MGSLHIKWYLKWPVSCMWSWHLVSIILSCLTGITPMHFAILHFFVWWLSNYMVSFLLIGPSSWISGSLSWLLLVLLFTCLLLTKLQRGRFTLLLQSWQPSWLKMDQPSKVPLFPLEVCIWFSCQWTVWISFNSVNIYRSSNIILVVAIGTLALFIGFLIEFFSHHRWISFSTEICLNMLNR